MNFKACIFDLDGVIVDTAKYHYLAWKRLADELGFDFTIEQNERLKGVSRMRSLEILLESGKITFPSNVEMEKMASRKNKWYVDSINQLKEEEILPGAKELLSDLRKRGVKIALGSASKNAPLILNRLKIENLFDSIVDGSKVATAKPNPEVFQLGAKELKVQPEECIVFEDAQAGIDAAIAGKMLCVGIGNSENLIGADFVVEGLKDISYEILIHKLYSKNLTIE